MTIDDYLASYGGGGVMSAHGLYPISGGPEVTVIDGQAYFVDQQGNPTFLAVAKGQPASNVPAPTSAASTTTPTTTSTTPTSTTGTTGTNTAIQEAAAGAQADQQFQTYLTSLNLTADQKAALTAIYSAIGTNDTAAADKIKAAMSAATEYSDPYFKAQANLVTDALSRGLTAKEGDLDFQRTSLTNSLNDLTSNIASSKDYLSFQQNQELKALQQKYETDLENTHTNLAALGKTNSSVRARSDELLNDNNTNMIESTNRDFAYKSGQLDSQQTAAARDTALQIANLQRVTDAGALDLTRSAEEQVGSTALSNLGYTDILGGVGGAIPREQTQDAISFAQNFVF